MARGSLDIPEIRVKVEDLLQVFRPLVTSLKAWRITQSEDISSRIGLLIIEFDNTLFQRQHGFEDFCTKSWRFTLEADREKTVCKELVLLVMRSVFSLVEQWGWQEVFGHQGGELRLPTGAKSDGVLATIDDIVEAVGELDRIVVSRPDHPNALAQDQKPWHICDHVFEPITRALEEIIKANNLGDLTKARTAEQSLLLLQHSDDILYAKEWLGLYFDRLPLSPRQIVEDLIRRLSPLLVAIADWEQAHAVVVAKGDSTRLLDQHRFSLTTEWQSFLREVEDSLLKLRFYSDQLRQHVRFDAPPVRFFPTDLQQRIIKALFRSPMTLEQLANQLGMDSKTVLAPGRKSSNPQRKGGIKELLGLGVVANDSTRRGYYLPTAPQA